MVIKIKDNFTAITIAETQKDPPCVNKHVKELDISFVISGHVKQYNHFIKQFGIQSRHSSAKKLSMRKENVSLCAKTCTQMFTAVSF